MATNITNLNLNINPLINIPLSIATGLIHNDSNYILNVLGIKSHGTITFRRNCSNRANFIRISSDFSPTRIKELFLGQHHDKRPILVISITGNVREYNMKSKLFRILRQGLLKIAKTTDVWIITDGITSNITKLLGEIIRTNPYPSRPIYLMGIVSWGCMSGVEQFDVHGTNAIYSKSKNDEKPLEPNHTHFIFIDDGTKYKHEGEIEFRAQFERAITEETLLLQTTTNYNQRKDKLTRSYSHEDSVSVVLVVVDNGLDTIRKVYESVVKNKIPAVLIQGTGGCCDLFAKCYHLYDEYHSERKLSDQANNNTSSLATEIKNKIREKLQTILNRLNIGSHKNILDKNERIDYFELIYECVETRNIYLNFLDLKLHNHVDVGVDLAILQALLKVTSENDLSERNIEQKREQLNLAFEWKRIDIMTNFIMKDEKDWKTIDLDDLFEKALLQNQINFVQLFLDHDFPLNDLYDNTNKLLNLYKNENYDFKVDLNNPLRSIYTEIIQPFIGDFFQVDVIFSSNNSSEDSSTGSSSNHHHHQQQRNLQSIDYSLLTMNEIDVDKELFLWSVLTGKQELALLFWARTKNKVCAALIAMLIYKNKARKEKEIIYNEWANIFENLAGQILGKFYSIHPYECTQAIIRQIPQFGNVTWLHLAVMAEAKLFIAQRGIQDVLNDIWYGYIDHTVGNGLIIFSSFMLWYSGYLPYQKQLTKGNDKFKKNDDFQERSNIFQNNSSRSNYNIDDICRTSDGTSLRLMDDVADEEKNSITVINTSLWKRIKTSVRQYMKNVFMFVHAPCVKYLYTVYSHVIFLMLFSYVILCDFFPLYEFESDGCLPNTEKNSHSKRLLNNINKDSMSNLTINEDISSKFGLQQHNRPTVSEIILTIWIYTLLCEGIRQLISMEVPSMYRKLGAYFTIFWNKLDVLAIFLFFIAFILRFLPMSQCFCAARIILALDLSIWYIRGLEIFSAVKRLGPKLVMIGEMAQDLKFFMLMLTVFLLAFGVPTYSLIFGVQKFSWHIPRVILNVAYWQVFGELEVLDDIEKNYEISGYVVFILLIAYMTVASVLLINLLIAMFSHTLDRLHADTDCIWKFQRYSLVCHHLTRPSLPPPLIIFSHIYRLMIYVFSRIFKRKWFYTKNIERKNREKFKIIINEMLTKKIEAIEDALGNEVYLFSLKIDRKQIDYQNDFNEERVYSSQEIILNKVKTLEKQIQVIQHRQDDMFQYLQCLMNGMKKIGGDDIEIPKQCSIDCLL